MNISFELITCPYCGESSVTELQLTFNTREDEDIYQRLINEEVSNCVCPVCDKELFLVDYVAYEDPDNNFIVYFAYGERYLALIDAIEANKAKYNNIKNNFTVRIEYRYFPLFIEKITILHHKLNDLAIILYKLNVSKEYNDAIVLLKDVEDKLKLFIYNGVVETPIDIIDFDYDKYNNYISYIKDNDGNRFNNDLVVNQDTILYSDYLKGDLEEPLYKIAYQEVKQELEHINELN